MDVAENNAMTPEIDAGVCNILVVYFAMEYPLRATIHDHLYSFARYSQHRVFYVNIAVCPIPEYLRQVDFDLIILHTTATGRWFPDSLWRTLEPAGDLRSLGAPIVAMPQDEFLNTDQLIELVHRYDVRYLFSVAQESQWPLLYGRLDPGQTTIHRVLTGYLDPGTLERIGEMALALQARSLDIGYRAYESPPWLGRLGSRKAELARRFLRTAPMHGLEVDISTRPQDTLLGDAWYRFLLRCKYTIGVEGGSSILDHDGTVKQCTEAYLRRNPHAIFEEVEDVCFPGQDGTLQLASLSPRHLEACATGTCQVLIEGTYDGILKPGVHYIELCRDFSNLDDVIKIICEDRLREQIISNAYRDIVQSNKYTYKQFVDSVFRVALADVPPRDRSAEDDAYYRQAREEDRKSWRKIKYISAIGKHVPMRIRRMGGVASWLRKIYFSLR